MGQYEPNDSRDVTLNKGNTPGEPPRTGPREGETRKDQRDPRDTASERDRQPAATVRRGEPVKQPQHKGVQVQSQSQSQSQGQKPAERTSDDMLNSDIGKGPLAGDQPQAIDNATGSARPEFDQYELNSPQNMHHDSAEDQRRREQAKGQSDTSLGERSARDLDERGYGDAAAKRKDVLDDTE